MCAKHYRWWTFPHMCLVQGLLSLTGHLGPICHSHMALLVYRYVFFWYEIGSRTPAIELFYADNV